MEEEKKLNEEEEKALNDLIIILAKKNSIPIQLDENGVVMIQEEDIETFKSLIENHLKLPY